MTSKPITVRKHDSFLVRNRKSGGMLLRQVIRKKSGVLLRTLMLFGLCFLILQPILDKISVSFMMEKDLYDTTIIAVPRNLTTENYELAAQLLNLNTSLLNTALISLATALLQPPGPENISCFSASTRPCSTVKIIKIWACPK